MKLPEARTDPDWAHLRAHDVEELWDHSISPHVASAHAARMGLASDVVSKLAGDGGRILDVGCAQGTLGLTLAERGFQVSLLDVRSINIDYSKARHERGQVEFYVGLLGSDMPPQSGYDVVICTEVLEHVPAPSMLLCQLADKVRPGGAVFVTTPNAEYLLSRLPAYGKADQHVIDSSEINSLDGNAHRFLYTKDELISLVRGVGLRIEDHGFFLPAWLEGHGKTRHIHRMLYRVRGKIMRLPATLPRFAGLAAKHLCSSQWLVARAG
jgi:2-polyprenyl-3-methyl-5-hydroxy-6-metoxy-1,4-benzoquinol methylase